MSLFQCDDCGCRENTACCNYWWNKSEGKPAQCSACDPEIKKWHDKFPRLFLGKGMFRTGKNGNLEHRETGDQNCEKYAVPNVKVRGAPLERKL